MSIYEKTYDEMTDVEYAAVVADLRESWEEGLTEGEIESTTVEDIYDWMALWMEREDEADWAIFLRSLTDKQLRSLAESVARAHFR